MGELADNGVRARGLTFAAATGTQWPGGTSACTVGTGDSCQPTPTLSASAPAAANSRAYANGGVLVPSEHHIGQFHEWVSQHLDAGTGALGAVTVSTQMAGRGVDIRLGGSDEKKSKKAVCSAVNP